MRVLDLFSGIGGFSLGLERAGMRTVSFCEIDPYCRAVIARHWPGVPILGDIHEVTADTDTHGQLQPSGAVGQERRRLGDCGIEIICGGFPCQDISVAGKGAGLAGARSGLWSEYHRLIGELRPRYAIVENVSALLSRGLEQVLADLASIGYDAEWHCIPASYVGAPHRRDRIWIVAYPAGAEPPDRNARALRPGPTPLDAQRRGSAMADPARDVRAESPPCWTERQRAGASSEPLDDTKLARLEGQRPDAGQSQKSEPRNSGWWESEPDVGRVAHGVPARVDRLRSLGNAVVPQVVEVIGRAIMRCAT